MFHRFKFCFANKLLQSGSLTQLRGAKSLLTFFFNQDISGTWFIHRRRNFACAVLINIFIHSKGEKSNEFIFAFTKIKCWDILREAFPWKVTFSHGTYSILRMKILNIGRCFFYGTYLRKTISVHSELFTERHRKNFYKQIIKNSLNYEVNEKSLFVCTTKRTQQCFVSCLIKSQTRKYLLSSRESIYARRPTAWTIIGANFLFVAFNTHFAVVHWTERNLLQPGESPKKIILIFFVCPFSEVI